MYTFQDLLSVGDNELRKGEFCRKAIESFMVSPEYRNAKIGEAYYAKHNKTIENYRKMLTTLSGRQVEDVFSANYKLKTLFFRRLVTQQVQYVLGNGLTLSDVANKEKLGRSFDYQLQLAAKRAMAGGQAFGFWNYDHLEVFGFADTSSEPGFCPLYSTETAELEAGIRYWFRTVDKKTIVRMTLYEADGITEYIQTDTKEPVQVLESKKAYKKVENRLPSGEIESVQGENYGKLPIVPLYANDTHESELVGIRESIDCYDFVKSGLANDIDDTSGFYWILKNTGGMDDVDLAKFIQRMKTVKATAVEGDQDATAEPHTLAIPTDARTKMLEILRKDIYEDFQALDVTTLSAAAKTTQEIQAAYQSQDNKCSDFEYLVLEFVYKILELAGIDDNPTFTWNRVVNQMEQTQMVMMCAEHLPEEVLVKHLPFLTPEEADIVLSERTEADFSRFNEEGDEE